MLTLHVEGKDVILDDDTIEKIPSTDLQLEHSLVSVHKWEQRWHKPYLVDEPERGNEEIIDYVRCMTINKEPVDQRIYYILSNENIKRIVQYIKDPMTATTITLYKQQEGNKNGTEYLTAEVIYSWMISLGIPIEFQYWHLNSLFTLIRVVDIKQSPNNKMSKAETAKVYEDINERNKKFFKAKK